MSEFITDAQFRKMLGGKSARTTGRWRSEGIGPRYIRAGGQVLYRLSDVEEWLASRTFRHTAAEATGRHATP